MSYIKKDLKYFFAKRPINSISFLAFFFLVVLPGAYYDHPMWDGVIIQYAYEINDLSGLKSWSLESGWPLFFFFNAGIIKLSNILQISFDDGALIIVSLCFILLLKEIYFISKNVICLSEPAARFSCFFATSFHIWHILLSDVMVFHLACLAICLTSVRWLHSNNLKNTICGLLGLVLSFGLSSLLLFSVALSYLHSYKKSSSLRKATIVDSVTVAVLAISIAYFFFFRAYFPPSGAYSNYNQFVEFSVDGISRAINAANLYNIYFIIVALQLFLILFSILKDKENSCQKSNFTIVLILLGLVSTSIAPYVAVGKGTAPSLILDWSARHALLLVVPMSLIGGMAYHGSPLNCDIRTFRVFQIIVSWSFVIYFLLLQITGTLSKANRQVFSDHLARVIKNNVINIPTGALIIYGNGIPGPKYRTYESNYLLYKATGATRNWTKISPKNVSQLSIPCSIQANEDYQRKFIFSYDSSDFGKITRVELLVSGFKGTSNIIRNTLQIDPQSHVSIKRISTQANINSENGELCR